MCRCWRCCRLAALAADYSLVGHAAAWRQVLLLVVAFVLSLLTVRGTIGVSAARVCGGAGGGDRAGDGVDAGHAVACLQRAAVHRGVDRPVHLEHRQPDGLTCAARCNRVRTPVALTYESGTPLTLRMATLGDFDGDTLSYEEQFAKDGSLYGSGIQLGHDSSNTLSDEERTAGMMTPLSL